MQNVNVIMHKSGQYAICKFVVVCHIFDKMQNVTGIMHKPVQYAICKFVVV